MILLVSGATRTVHEYPVGRFIVPDARNKPHTLNLQRRRWAMDCGGFKGFKPGPFVTMLEQFYGQPECLFVVAPDVVGRSDETLKLWPFWSRLIRSLDYPVAFVAQDGQTVETAPWNEMDALFIGGTTEFKLGPQACTLMGYAKARGLWVHMGRVNSKRRMRLAARQGADSFDGTSTSIAPRTNIPKRLRQMREIQQQPELGL